MITLKEIIQVVINGLLIGGVYGLAALGLSLICGVMKVVNLGHGVFIMLGAYISYWAFPLLGIHPLVSMILGLLIGLGGGMLIYRYLIDRGIPSASNDFEMEMMTLLLTFAISIIIYGAALNVWAADLKGIPILMPSLSILGFEIPTSRLIIFIVAAILGASLYQFLKRTYIGKAIRAVMQSRNVSIMDSMS
ncbi:MAG: branched-chain amino acid ABC transporter permease [Thermodesulfobacteriota bacterium]